MNKNNTLPTILLIDDKISDVKRYLDIFDQDFAITLVTNDQKHPQNAELPSYLINQAEQRLLQHTYDAIWLDLDLQGNDDFKKGLPNIQHFKRLAPDTPIVVVSHDDSTSTVVLAIQNGAVDYLCKHDYDFVYWRDCFNKHIGQARLRQKDQQLKKALNPTKDKTTDFVGGTPAVQKIKKELEKLGQLDHVTVLLLGETGVGKEVAARYLHQKGSRKQQAFVPINLSAIPANLIESTLFGHQKGAFTGAEKDHKGVFEEANGGILFLDEIGDAPYDVQTKLLRFLEDGKVRPTGGQEKQLDVQVIAATNVDLRAAIAEKKFRQDLYERLRGFPIHLPPLRERKNDMELLCKHFQQKTLNEIATSDTIALMQAYHWPGNVRELRNTLKSMTIKSLILEQEKATIECLPEELQQFQLFKQKLPHIDGHSPAQNDPSNIEQQQALIELNAIENALVQSKAKKTEAAELLHKNTDQLLYAVKKNFAEYPQLFKQYPNICAAYKLNPK